MDDPPTYTPQAFSDILPIYGHIHIYDLRQTSESTQILSARDSNATSPISYEIRSNKTGGFMNKKPHVIITTKDERQRVAEGRFDIHGTGTRIDYSRSSMQRLELENSVNQTIRTQIQDSDMWWQPHPGNKEVLELTNETDEIVARFVPASSVSPCEARKNKKASIDVDVPVGELQVVDALDTRDEGYEQILCSALVVIERAKRRSAFMAKRGSPLTHHACWGMSAPPPGGFI